MHQKRVCMLREREPTWKLCGSASAVNQGPSRLSWALVSTSRDQATFSRWSFLSLKARREETATRSSVKSFTRKRRTVHIYEETVSVRPAHTCIPHVYKHKHTHPISTAFKSFS